MNTIFNKPFDDIEEADFIDLVEKKKVREYIGLDYKQGSYSHKHDGVVELLADITAMANASGGYLIIGVEEDKEADDGTPKEIMGIENGDAEANWIGSVVLTNIDEPVPGLRVRDVPLNNGQHLVVIEIPNSIKKPHMVVHEKHRSFRIRHGRSNAIVGMREVREMILTMSSYQVTLEKFIKERIQDSQEAAGNAPFMLLLATPIYTNTERLDPFRDEYRLLLLNKPGLPDPNMEGIRFHGDVSPRYFGLEALSSMKNPMINSPDAYLRLFRNGHIEFHQNYEKDPQTPHGFFSYDITVTLLHFLTVAQQIYAIEGYNDPLVLNLVLGNANPSLLTTIFRPVDRLRLDQYYIWRKPLLPIDATVSSLDSVKETTSRMIDRLFNAYGRAKNSHFNDRSELVRPSR